MLKRQLQELLATLVLVKIKLEAGSVAEQLFVYHVHNTDSLVKQIVVIIAVIHDQAVMETRGLLLCDTFRKSW